jgi:hypothetical protein
MRKMPRLVLAMAFAVPALLSQRAHASVGGYVCVNDCSSECPIYCYNWYCEILSSEGCEETNGMACHCF